MKKRRKLEKRSKGKGSRRRWKREKFGKRTWLSKLIHIVDEDMVK